MTAYTIVMLIMMIVSTGMAVDYMRHESYRAELQDALDRGVLAAAAFSQDADAEQTVRDYMKTANWIEDDVELDVNPTGAANFKRVQATAEYSVPTFFLKLIGINRLAVRAEGIAEQRLKEVEISLVLDISTSMADEEKIEYLKDAANEFVDAVLTDETRPYTTISVIPYSGHVNAGPDIYSRMTIAPLFDTFNHGYQHCIEFSEADLDDITLDPTTSRSQLQFFVWGGYGSSTPDSRARFGWCPRQASSILAFSNDNDELKEHIDGLVLHEATGIQNGMKWGVGMLDPSFNPIVSDMATDGLVDADFNDRPLPYGEEGSEGESLKFVVLMTDGMITPQIRIKSSYYDSVADVDFWATNHNHEQWWRSSVSKPLASNSPSIRAIFKSTGVGYQGPSSSAYITDRANNAATLQEQCTETKNAGVTVFTIAFGTGAEVGPMQTCATSLSHFYQADTSSIDDVFDDIANTMQNLKLIY